MKERSLRTLAWLGLLGIALVGWGTSAIGDASGEAALIVGTVQLELPDLGEQKYAPGVLRIPEPEKIRRLVLHIPLARVHQAHPKINTIATGPVQTIRARQTEVLCEIDLSLHQGRFYALNAADNTVEIKVVPRPGADPVYAQWVIAPPKEPQAWRAHKRFESGARPERAEMGSEGLVVLEELEDGRLSRLEKGVTTARRIFFQARFPRREESVSLRVRWVGEDGTERAFSVGDWRSGTQVGGKPLAGDIPALEGSIDLDLGLNRVDVEVLHGYTALSRSTYRIYRRAPHAPNSVVGEKWAVVIGISDYHAEGLDLRYADRDAQGVYDFLMKGGGFRSDRVLLLKNQDATQQQIRTALFNFLAGAQPEDLVLIFMAGHGKQDDSNPDNFFFLAHDSVLGNLGGTAIPMWDLGNVLDYTIRSNRTMIFADTCHSGAALERGGPVDGNRLNFFNKYLEVLARKRGRLVVTASQAHEKSLEMTLPGEVRHGAFTHAMLLGLQGAADDNPSDGVVTAGELVDYLRVRVPDGTAGEQHPSYDEEGFDMSLPLAHIRSRKGS